MEKNHSITLQLLLLILCAGTLIRAAHEDYELSPDDGHEEPVPLDPKVRSLQCFPQLGCLTTDWSWFSLLNRPFNYNAWTREAINTNFTLYTRWNPYRGVGIDKRNGSTIADSLAKSYFSAFRSTKVIVHGWKGNGSLSWIEDLKDALLDLGDFNIIVTSWAEGSQPHFYPQAVMNLRVVGLEIAFLLNAIIEKKLINPPDLHLIGYSLGAHGMGYAGEKIPKLGRITGLDPAGPYFHTMPTHVRLDPSDAQFVDVIHTDAANGNIAFGISEQVGHVGFYVNGGSAKQPGCQSQSLLSASWNVDDMISVYDCSHRRATTLFVDSLQRNANCRMVGYECLAGYEAFLKGECNLTCGNDGSKCAPLGLDSIYNPTRGKANVKLFLTTEAEPPFCQHNYQVMLNLAKPSEASNWVHGKVVISISGDKGATSITYPSVNSQSGDADRFYHGQQKKLLATSRTAVGNIISVNIRWEYVQNWWSPSTLCFFGCNSKLYVANITIVDLSSYTKGRSALWSVISCSANKAPFVAIQSTYDSIFRPNSCSR